jgi:hypothetical protein
VAEEWTVGHYDAMISISGRSGRIWPYKPIAHYLIVSREEYHCKWSRLSGSISASPLHLCSERRCKQRLLHRRRHSATFDVATKLEQQGTASV